MSAGIAEAGDLRDDRRGAGDGVRGAVPVGVPVGLLQQRLLGGVDQVAAFGLQLLQEGVVDRGVDEDVAVGRAAGSVVVGLADRGVARRLHDVRGLVDHHRRVAGADAVGRLARAVRALHHRRAAGGDGQVAGAHQLVGERDARALDALQQILGRAELAQRRAHHPHGLVRRLPAAGVRREDDRVLALDRVDRDGDRRDVRAGDRNQRRDHASRLGVLDDALVGDLLDDADALLAQGVAQHALHLGAALRLGAAHAALVHAHLRERGRGRSRCRRPRRSPGTGDRPPPGRRSRPRASPPGRGRAASGRSPVPRG